MNCCWRGPSIICQNCRELMYIIVHSSTHTLCVRTTMLMMMSMTNGNKWDSTPPPHIITDHPGHAPLFVREETTEKVKGRHGVIEVPVCMWRNRRSIFWTLLPLFSAYSTINYAEQSNFSAGRLNQSKDEMNCDGTKKSGRDAQPWLSEWETRLEIVCLSSVHLMYSFNSSSRTLGAISSSTSGSNWRKLSLPVSVLHCRVLMASRYHNNNICKRWLIAVGDSVKMASKKSDGMAWEWTEGKVRDGDDWCGC